MQTFLPFEDFTECAKVLDYRRLGKQRVESCQVLNALAGNSKGWVNHPAVKMWRGFEHCLIDYNIAICEEWISRGYKDSMADKTLSFLEVFQKKTYAPKWLGDKHLHDSYKGVLFHKNPDYYKEFQQFENLISIPWPV